MDTEGDDEAALLARLLLRCAGGERAALRQLYDLQAPRLKGFAVRVTGSAILAEDVVHDVFVRVWQEAGRFDPARGSARAWLTTLTRFRALDIMRRAGREVTGLELPEEEDDGPDAFTLLASRAEGRALRACMAGLPDAPRRMIVLAFVHGHTHATLSQTLHMPLGTVKSRVRLAMKRLRAILESEQ